MERLYFIFSQGSTILTFFIKAKQRWLDYTHAAIVLDKTDIYNPEVVAAVTKVNMGKFYDIHSGFARQKKWKYYYVEGTKEQLEAYKEFARRSFNKGYDIKGVIAFGLNLNTHNPDKYFCTELLYETLWKVGIDLLQNTMSYEANVYLMLKSWLIKEDVELNKKVWEHYGWK